MQMTANVRIPTGDIVQMMLVLAFERGNLDVIKEETIYHSLKKMTEEYPTRFDGLHFSILPTSKFPYSGELEDTLFRLSSAGIINRTGWKMSSFVIDEKMIKAVQESFIKYYGEPALAEMQDLSKRFLELILAHIA
jgi:hypothetical protein